MRSLGHDFVVMDLLTQAARAHHMPVSQWADMRTGIGFTYLLLIEQPLRPNTDFSLRVLDAQGHEVGNISGAVACATRYVIDRGLTGQSRIKFFVGGTIKKNQQSDFLQEAIGQRVKVVTSFNQGAGRVELNGVQWTAYSEEVLSQGDTAWITHNEGIELYVASKKTGSSSN